MASKNPPLPVLEESDPEAILRDFFRKKHPRIAGKVERQVRRTPRRQTGDYKTNRECRWGLAEDHPDYTAPGEIARIEAKLYSMALEFQSAPRAPEDVAAAVSTILGRALTRGAYRCPVTGRPMSFTELLEECENPKAGRSTFHVGHVRPRARKGGNTADNTYWTTDLGNRIQGDKSWHETVKIIVEMAEFHRTRENISWGEVVNRFLG